MPKEEIGLAVLTRLERLEAALLSWGYVDGGFLREEVVTVAEDLGADDGEDVLDDLIQRALLVQVRVGRQVTFRTRSGEAIRLVARLRQLFPKHLVQGGWRQAPTLVSDFRYTLRPRTYPSREIPPEEVLAALTPGQSELTRRALTALIATRGPDFRAARFQVDAARRILDDLGGTSSRATIVGAGTGSGKTLAFYLPALAHIAEDLAGDRWTKAIAVYPRNELLKDQFSETYGEARRLDVTLAAAGSRKLIIGAFFGPTPHSASILARSKDDSDRTSWARSGAGFVCPFLRCPECGGDLTWPDADIKSNTERLTCRVTGCGKVIGDDEIVLTRTRMRTEPPDVLFTTTEMLNRQISDGNSSHVFGVGPRAPRKPHLMLLDEVHTYEGISGAQAACVIRRWRHAVGRPVQFVGLSATLREAQSFFGELVGVPDHAVSSIAPAQSDLTSEGMEYLVALRGDPVSGTSLLSTTIQTSMLLRRILDPTMEAGAHYGSRLFCFTDDLDVTNRLYFDLLDAEGRDSWGKPLTQGPGPLAALRASVGPEHVERLGRGQSWDLCEAIGHHLDSAGSLRIGRTSSQDPGVMGASDIVVATASLDVGFNDPSVGAVLQHKAPRGAAQFLQRKGRAGRIRGMRPWTVVVLSDYGRDRLAYQGYELLFDPVLESRSLPTGNTYVLKIQAAFAFMDWLATKLPSNLRGSVWMDLAGPPSVHQPGNSNASKRQQLELELTQKVLTDDNVRAELLSYISRSLRLSPEQLEIVGWEAPRSLILHLLPTLRRRLASSWSRNGDAGEDYQVKYQPVPDFVPANLFSDLSLPETLITLPPVGSNDEESETQAPVIQALRTFAPGRVSRRYGVEHRFVRHWVPVPFDSSVCSLDLDSFTDGPQLGHFDFERPDGSTERFMGVRPWTIRTERPPRELLDATNSTLRWRSQFDPVDQGDEAEVPSPSPWDAVIKDVRTYTHARRSGLDLMRLAVGADATVLFQSGAEHEVAITFVKQGEPAALGIRLDVDAISVDACVPEFFSAGHPYRADGSSWRSFRSSYFQDSVSRDPDLASRANSFQRQWLAQLFLSYAVERALLEGITIQQVIEGTPLASVAEELQRVLTVIFEAGPAVGEEEVKQTGDDAHRPRLDQRLLDLTDDPAVTTRLVHLATSLWKDPDDGWQKWAAERFAATLGAALLLAADRLCHNVGAEALVVDTVMNPDSCSCRVWLSEPSIGGGGIVEEFARRYAEDPRRYFRLVEAALAPSDFEIVDSELTRAIALAVDDSTVRAQIAALRAADSHEVSQLAMRNLLHVLDERGIAATHPVIAAMNARVLRPGSSAESDSFMRELVEQWRREEVRLGVEIDARVFAFAASASEAADSLLDLPHGGTTNRQWRFGTIYGLLWPRGAAVRASSLRAYNPYHPLPATDRVLLLSAVSSTADDIELADYDWPEQVGAALVRNGTASLRARPTSARALRRAIVELQAVPIDAGYLFLHPRVIGFERRDGDLIATFELREAYQ